MGWAIALHGGAGDIPLTLPSERRQPREAGLRHCLAVGVAAIKAGRSPLDVSELVVRELENWPHFNAGIGSVLTADGTVEMEACIMDGNTMTCGAVSGITTVLNPISLARSVMENSPHVYLGFSGAEDFARKQRLETVDPSDFITPENVERLKQAKDAKRVQVDYTKPTTINKESLLDTSGGTVGCVVSDGRGALAAATSTGGLVNKLPGRIGDTPIIGAGNYANGFCAVSATGFGENIIRGTIARDVAAVMEFKGLSLKDSATYVVNKAPKGSVGIVTVSADGDVAMAFNTTGMFRACATEEGYSEVSIWN